MKSKPKFISYKTVCEVDYVHLLKRYYAIFGIPGTRILIAKEYFRASLEDLL